MNIPNSLKYATIGVIGLDAGLVSRAWGLSWWQGLVLELFGLVVGMLLIHRNKVTTDDRHP